MFVYYFRENDSHSVFFVKHTSTTQNYTYRHPLSLHDALPICVRYSYGEATVSIPALTDLKADDQVKPPCLDAQKNGKRKLGRGEKEDDAYKKKSAVRRCSRYRAPGHTVTTCSGTAAEPIDAVPRDKFAHQMALHGVHPHTAK